MWKGLGNLKTGLNDITSKTISSVAKAGNRAKELINQIDNDEFFEQEFNTENVLKNPLDNPLVKLDSKGKKKDDLATSEKETSSSKGNSLNQLPLGEDISPIKFDNSLPKIYSTKKQKAADGSSSPSNSKKEQKKKQIAKESTPTGVLTESNQAVKSKQQSINDLNDDNNGEVKKTKVDQNPWGVAEVFPDQPRKENTIEKDTTTEKEKKNKDARKEEKAPNNKEIEELKTELNEKDEALERFAIDNDQLLKERNEVKALADSYQEKINTLDKNLTQILGKNNKLEEQINKLNKDLIQARQKSTVADIHPEVPQERKDAIDGYIHHCIEQYKTDLSLKLVQNLNNDLLEQLVLEEGEVSEEVKELMNLWIVKPELASSDIIPTEKIIQPFYDENLLKEEIECQKQENSQLRTKAQEYEERIRQLENQLQEQQSVSDDFKQETNQTLKKYTEDFVKFEQDIENMREEMAEYKAVLNARTEDLQKAEKSNQEKDTQIKQLEDQVRSETAAKEDLGQQYESIVQGMKDFEKTMMDLNTENERLSSEYQTMKDQLEAQVKKVKENQHTLSLEVKTNLLEKFGKLNCFYAGYEIQTAIDSRLGQSKDGRISSEELFSLLDSELAVVIEKISGKFNSELEEERGKEREKYNALAKNLEQVQGELKESEKREKKLQDGKEKVQKKNDELTAKIESLNTAATEKKNKIKELEKTINELQETKRKYLDDVGAKNEEFEQLKIKFNALQEQATESQGYLSRLEAEASAIPELSERLERQTLELNDLSELLRSKTEENEHLNMTINNLQSVIDENQQIQENLSNQSYNEIKRLRNDFEQASRKSQILQEYKDKFEALEKETADKEAKIKELNIKLKESEQERNAIKAEASALVSKAKNEAMYKDNLVDKRVLTSFLVKYFDSNATFAVKLGILETMSSILGFNDDDRSKVGLPRLVPLVEPKEEDEEEKVEQTENTNVDNGENEGAPEHGEQPQKSLKQLFMSFLKDNQ